MNLPDGHFGVSHSIPTGWTHVVLNYIGPSNGQGIMIYYDGVEVANGTARSSYNSFPSGYGRVVVGRYFINKDKEYTSVQVDELIYFNNSLTNEQIEMLVSTA